MRWKMHGLVVEGRWDHETIGQRWAPSFASLPKARIMPDLVLSLGLTSEVPQPPGRPPDFQQGDLLAYYLEDEAEEASDVIAHLPRYGQLRLDLEDGATEGLITPAALATPGVFEDLVAIGLSPHLRRRGQYLLHAFAAVSPTPLHLPDSTPGGVSDAEVMALTPGAPGTLPPFLEARPERPGAGPLQPGSAVLLVGDIGAGKTTTGLALLHAGWSLLSNDSPLLTAGADGVSPQVLAYPGLLSAYPDTLARFPELAQVQAEPGREKTLFAAETVFPGVWVESAAPGAILFPQVEAREAHALERLPAAEALRMLLPHAIEQWDKAYIAPHLALLRLFVESAPAYRLRLAPDTTTLPGLLAGLGSGPVTEE